MNFGGSKQSNIGYEAKQIIVAIGLLYFHVTFAGLAK